jgi:two-component system response regulator RstA
LVEDDCALSELVSEYLTENGFYVDVEESGDNAVGRILSEQPDMVILDVMLPGIDGFTVCRRARDGYEGPILMLTARGEEVDELTGFDCGADEYLRKPIRPKVLLARVHALLKRCLQVDSRLDDKATQNGSSTRIVCGALIIDSGQRSVHLDGTVVPLTTAEFELLWYLAENRGRVVTREELYRNVQGIEYDGLDRTIDFRISRLRKKLGGDLESHDRLIKTIRGAGYQLVESVPCAP